MRPSNERATVITVLNLKGGVGKTHATWLMASVCQERRRNVLLVDTDTQGNLTSSFLDSSNRTPGVEALLNPAEESDPDTLVRSTPFRYISIIPSGSALAAFDLSDQPAWERADLHLSFVDPVRAWRSQYDFIVFDCPPRLSLVSFAALCASDAVIIPMEAADWGAQGVMQVSEATRYVQERFNPRLQLLGYLVSRFRRARAYQRAYLKQLQGHFGPLAFDTVVPDLAKFEKSVVDRIPITLHAPGSEEATIARDFFDEVQARTQGQHRLGPRRRRAHVRRVAVPAA